MANELQGKKIAFIATEGVEQVELTEPWKAVEQAGAQPELISIEPGQVQAFNYLDKADKFDVDATAAGVDAPGEDGADRHHNQAEDDSHGDCSPQASPTGNVRGTSR